MPVRPRVHLARRLGWLVRAPPAWRPVRATDQRRDRERDRESRDERPPRLHRAGAGRSRRETRVSSRAVDPYRLQAAADPPNWHFGACTYPRQPARIVSPQQDQVTGPVVPHDGSAAVPADDLSSPGAGRCWACGSVSGKIPCLVAVVVPAKIGAQCRPVGHDMREISGHTCAGIRLGVGNGRQEAAAPACRLGEYARASEPMGRQEPLLSRSHRTRLLRPRWYE